LVKPKPDLLKKSEYKPLIERNPVAFWRGVSAVLLLVIIFQFLWMDR